MKVTGRNLYVSFVHPGGTEILANATSGPPFRTITINMSTNSADVTAGDNTVRENIPTIQEFSVDFTAMYDNANTSLLQALQIGTSGTLIIGPEGNTTGKPRYAFLAFVRDYKTSFTFDEGIEFSVSFESAGEIIASPLNGDTF